MRRRCMLAGVALVACVMLAACGNAAAVNGGTPDTVQNIPAVPDTVTPLAGNGTPANILPTLTDAPGNIVPTLTATAGPQPTAVVAQPTAAPAPVAQPVNPPANGNGGTQACPTGHGGDGHDCRKDKGGNGDKSKGDDGHKKGDDGEGD